MTVVLVRSVCVITRGVSYVVGCSGCCFFSRGRGARMVSRGGGVGGVVEEVGWGGVVGVGGGLWVLDMGTEQGRWLHH